MLGEQVSMPPEDDDEPEPDVDPLVDELDPEPDPLELDEPEPLLELLLPEPLVDVDVVLEPPLPESSPHAATPRVEPPTMAAAA